MASSSQKKSARKRPVSKRTKQTPRPKRTHAPEQTVLSEWERLLEEEFGSGLLLDSFDSEPSEEGRTASSGGTQEQEVQCPFCFEWISVVVDLSQEEQRYIEDCSVCCRPIQFNAVCSGGELLALSTDRAS